MSTPAPDDLSDCFAGRRLYGDDFGADDIRAWFDDEAEGYADLSLIDAPAASAENYQYNRLNQRHGFRHLPPTGFCHALGLGSAFGGEFLPIIERIDTLTIVEPSHQLRSDRLGDVVPVYIDPDPSGDLPFEKGTFDLVLAIGVLHHIPNVSHVVREIARCVEPGGWVLIREPMTSMGDWRGPRPGLTRRERGIPRDLMRQVLQDAGLAIRAESPCLFPTSARLAGILPALGFEREPGVTLDAALSRLFTWNYRYHATTRARKLRPTSVFIVAKKH